jgi:hypothetical protein
MFESLYRTGMIGFAGDQVPGGQSGKDGRGKNDWESRWSKANKFILSLTEEKAVGIMQNH